MALIDRRVPLEACFNFRDLGGIETTDGQRVRPGVLYRADTLHRLTGPDLDVLRGLGLRTVVDLRTQGEIDEYGRIALADMDEVAYHHVPMIDELRQPDTAPDQNAPSPDDGHDRYVRMIEQGGPAVANALLLMADIAVLPAVFHCQAGKDRTGVLAALVLGHLGVSDEDIAADYAVSEQAVEATIAWIEATDPALAATFSTYPSWMWDARAELMLAFLESVRADHGSITALLGHLGVNHGTLDALLAVFLGPA